MYWGVTFQFHSLAGIATKKIHHQRSASLSNMVCIPSKYLAHITPFEYAEAL